MVSYALSLKDIPENTNLPWPEKWLSKMAKPFSWLFISLGIDGYIVTIISLLLGILGAAVAASGYLLLGFLAFCCYVLLDNTDGQVARFFKEPKEAGVYIDSRTHFIVDPIFFIGVGIGNALMAFNGNKILAFAFILAGFFAAIFYLMRQTMKVGDLGYPESGVKSLGNEKSLIGKIKYLIYNTIRINNPFGLMLWAIIFGASGYALFLYALLFAANTFSCFIGKFKELKNKGIGEAFGIIK